MKETKLKIHTWPEDVLRRRCRRVDKVDSKVQELLDQMYALMCIEDGVGLAAPQVGLSLQLVVVKIEDHVFKLVNPRIVNGEGTLCFKEGCLSFPGLEIDIKRARKVTVEAQDESGRLRTINVRGLLAVVLQHEIDHINGIVFIDRIPFWRRVAILPQLQKIAAKTRRRRKA